jgi:hypothetical protein
MWWMHDVPASPHARHNVVGWLGLACGLLALAASLVPAWVAPLYDPPAKPLPTRASEWLGQLRDYAMGAEGDGGAIPPPVATNPWRSPRLSVASLMLAFAALVCAAIAFVRREDTRMVACTVALGAGAMAGYSLVTAMMVLLVALTAVVLAAVGRRA